MFKKLLFGIGLSLLGWHTANAQRTCATMSNLDRLEMQYPGTKAQLKALDRKIAQQTPKANQRMAATIITIPVVVHVIYANATQNISQAQIQSQLDVLNDDYSKLNADTTNIPPAFRSVAGNMQIRFELAKRDPNGDPTTGITRTQTNKSAFSDDDAMKFASRGGHDIWDRDKYLNIWVCNMGGGLLGYAQFPSAGPATTDGVAINYRYFGKTGTATAPFNKGRTATHEVGHWLGLYHIWGDEPACADDDLVNDTPLQRGENYDCPVFPRISGAGASCTAAAPGAMFMNYMDYVDDGCMNMFTNGQKTRVHNALNTSRNSLFTSNGLTPVVVQALDASIFSIISPPASSCFSQITPTVILKNKGNTTLTSATITYSVDNATPQTYQWTGSLATFETTTINLPVITVAAGNHTLTVATSQPNGQTDQDATNDSQTFAFVTTVQPQGLALPFSESFEGAFPPADWTLVNSDNDETWQKKNNTAKAGNASVFVNNYDYSFVGEADELIMPPLDLTTAASPVLTFELAYRRFSSFNPTTDTLEVLASADCGITYTSVYKKWGSALATVSTSQTSPFTPTSAQWRLETIPLSAIGGSNSIILKFRNTTGYENNLYLDDVKVTGGVNGLKSESKTESFNLYPNPTTGLVQLETGAIGSGKTEVMVSDMLGRVVLEKTIQSGKPAELDLSGNAPGLYLVQLKTEGKIRNQKLLLAK